MFPRKWLCQSCHARGVVEIADLASPQTYATLDAAHRAKSPDCPNGFVLELDTLLISDESEGVFA